MTSSSSTELTGNLMTGAYCVGLTLGALAAYCCDSVLGDPAFYHAPCPDTGL